MSSRGPADSCYGNVGCRMPAQVMATALRQELPSCRALLSLQLLDPYSKRLLRFKRRFLSRVTFLPVPTWCSHTSAW